MIRVKENEFRYVEFNEKKSNLTLIFEKENKEDYNKSKERPILTDDEYYDKYYKYVREYFCFINLERVEKPTITNKIEIGSTLINILNNKIRLQSIFKRYKDTFLEVRSYQELNKLMKKFEYELQHTNKDFTFLIYLLKCFLLELEIENQPIKKSKTSLVILLCDYIDQLEELEEIVDKLFIIPRNYYEDEQKMEELQLDIRKNYFSRFILPEANNIYKIYKYYPRIIKTEYQISNIIDLAYTTIYHISQNQDSISKCNYCNKYFTTFNKRNDTKNCCIECSNNSRKVATEKGLGEYIKVYYRIVNYLKRHKKLNQLQTFKNRYLSKKDRSKELYGNGEKYKQKLLEWLLYYEHKHIHKEK